MERSINYTKTFGTSSPTTHCTVNGQTVVCPEFMNHFSGPLIAGILIIYTAILIFLIIVPFWKVFKKAGKPGWASIIPIYNLVVMFQIAKRSPWLILLMCIPFVNIVVIILLSSEIAKSFGKGIGFAIGLILLPFIFYPILGYGKSQYIGNINNTSVPINPVTV